MTNLKSELREELEGQADWRRQKAEEYPNDSRNAAAAELLTNLAASVERCPQEVVDAYRELFDGIKDVEVWLEFLRTVGFHRWPTNAEELCREFIADRTGG